MIKTRRFWDFQFCNVYIFWFCPFFLGKNTRYLELIFLQVDRTLYYLHLGFFETLKGCFIFSKI
jgi:hypothetical protein